MAFEDKKDLVCLRDLTGEEIMRLIVRGGEMKQMLACGQEYRPLEGKTLAMIFQKPSTRTRVSFEVAMHQLGGHALYLGAGELQLARGETIADTARVLSRYCDAIMARVYAHRDIEELARYASVPVINGLSDFSHPCQALADLMTMYEKKASFPRLKVAYLGDGNNVAHSLAFACARVGAELWLATPERYPPAEEVLQHCERLCQQSGGKVYWTKEIDRAAEGADVLYTDVWASMGQEEQREERLRHLKPYQVNSRVVGRAAKDVIVMHCLPAHRGEEITDEVLDGPHSVVFDQAENRLHIQKAILEWLMVGQY
jgi:ornithine carbamoyltransferase